MTWFKLAHDETINLELCCNIRVDYTHHDDGIIWKIQAMAPHGPVDLFVADDEGLVREVFQGTLLAIAKDVIQTSASKIIAIIEHKKRIARLDMVPM